MTAYMSAEQGRTLPFRPDGLDAFVAAVARGGLEGAGEVVRIDAGRLRDSAFTASGYLRNRPRGGRQTLSSVLPSIRTPVLVSTHGTAFQHSASNTSSIAMSAMLSCVPAASSFHDHHHVDVALGSPIPPRSRAEQQGLLHRVAVVGSQRVAKLLQPVSLVRVPPARQVADPLSLHRRAALSLCVLGAALRVRARSSRAAFPIWEVITGWPASQSRPARTGWAGVSVAGAWACRFPWRNLPDLGVPCHRGRQAPARAHEVHLRPRR